jgi:hypothetical protein
MLKRFAGFAPKFVKLAEMNAHTTKMCIARNVRRPVKPVPKLAGRWRHEFSVMNYKWHIP